MPEVDVTTLEDDEFELLGRRAGAELRRSVPPSDPRAVRLTAKRRRTTTVIAATASIILLLIGVGVALADQEPGPDRVDTVTTPTTVPDPPRRLVLEGNGGMVGAFDFSADGRTVAAAGEDGRVRVWDATTGKMRQAIAMGSAEPLEHLAFSSDGRSVAVRTYGGDVQYRSAGNGARSASFAVTWLTEGAWEDRPMLSEDGSMRLEVGRYGPVTVIDVASGNVLQQVVGGGADHSYVGTFSPDGSMVAVKFGDHVEVWRVDTGASIVVFDFPDYNGTAERMSFSPDNRRLAFTVEDALIIETLP